MFINEIDFRRLFDGILKVFFFFLLLLLLYTGGLHGKSGDFLAKNVRCRCISSYMIQRRDRSPEVCRIKTSSSLSPFANFLLVKEPLSSIRQLFTFERTSLSPFIKFYERTSLPPDRCSHLLNFLGSTIM